MVVDKIVTVANQDLKDEYKGRLGLDVGNLWNILPSPMEEITQEEFMGIFLDYSPRFYTYHQSEGLSYKIWWYGSVVIGMKLDIIGARRAITGYFRFGCNHKNSTCEKTGNCEHKYTCKDCGYMHYVDSSD